MKTEQRKFAESRKIYGKKENSEEKWNRKILTKYAIEVYYNPICTDYEGDSRL